LQQHTEQVRAAAKEVYEHAVDLVHSAKASEQEAMAKTASEIEAKLKKADMARAAHLDELKEKATRQVRADFACTHCAERA
jgi:ribosomal protein L44E